ncbi:MAG TPA: ABC transporter ATP-binding protein [Stellaceae bacterium]|nr:ABC transporter ATP-binding protein [Stellaceae bacterium]
MIAAKDLTVALGGRDVVAGVSFTIATGEAFGVVGESGSGKSTLLRAIAGLVPITGGTLAVDGAAATGTGSREGGRWVQLVFQDPYGSLHPRHTVERALAEPLIIHHVRDRDARITAALDAVGLGSGFRSRYPHQLSGGQRQRVAIARALMLSPRLLLLDEPTSALDVLAQAEVIELLARLRAERGLSFLLVSHDLAVVATLVDRVAVMADGRFVETLDVAALRKGSAQSPQTRALIAASRGFRRGEVTPAARP